MLRSIKQLYGDKLGASDGEIGHVKDFYFNDRNWVIRFLVAETGSWLVGRQVLISPYFLGRLDQSEKIVRVNLTRDQIEKCPSIETHKPVSRQYEEEYSKYFGSPNYWHGDGLWGMSDLPIFEVPSEGPLDGTTVLGAATLEHADVHLRSAQAVNGYHLRTEDGTIGHICDFMVDAQSWEIGQLVIKTGHRFSGKEVLIPTKKVDRISYEESTVFVNLSSEVVERSPEHHLPPVAAVI